MPGQREVKRLSPVIHARPTAGQARAGVPGPSLERSLGHDDSSSERRLSESSGGDSEAAGPGALFKLVARARARAMTATVPQPLQG